MNRLSRNQWIAVAVAIIVVCYFLLYDLVGGMYKPSESATQNITTMNDEMNGQNSVPAASTTPAGATSAPQPATAPTGPAATQGSTVTVNYTLKLANGQIVDTSIGRGPFSFTIGQHMVIAGWENGLVGVRAGDHKNLVIPPDQGYGALQAGQPKMHPLQGETLYFDIDVLKVE